ncbi:MAG: hypothetical protein M1484_02820 [Patescibacteria group bacterium]|nr:hypothetical protein [Patescibacteria group bacterium]MCL5432014.1 hypothetical protein [Patescibacteria group bacterium]
MIEQAAISGAAKGGVYSQTLCLENFYLVLTLSDGPQEVNLELGRNTLAKIEEIITQSPQLKPSELIAAISADLPEEISVGILVARITDQQLILAAKGDVGAKLARRGKIINLAGATLSGQLQPQDLLILGTKDFISQLISNFPNADQTVNDLRDALLPKIEEMENNAGIAGLLLKFNPEQSESLPTKSFKFTPTLSELPAMLSRRTLYLAILALVTLVCVVAFQLRSRALEENSQKIAALQQMVTQAEKTGQRDVLLQTRQNFVSSAGDLKDPKVKAILDELDKQIAAVSHIYTLSSLDLFYDFGLLKAGVNVSAAGLHKGQITALDSANGAVYTVTTANKGANIITAADALKSAKFIDSSGDSNYIWTPSGIYSNDKLLLKPADKWGQIAGLATFAGNIYLLDKANSQIWKYQGTDLGFADLTPYLTAGSVDFSRVTGFAIDGYVYVLSSSGNIVKFSAGSAQDLPVAGLDKPFANPTGIFATDDTNNIYVLDSGNNRVVVLDKSGIYKSQYVFPSTYHLEPSTLLLADESTGKAFLLSGSKIFSFDLK